MLGELQLGEKKINSGNPAVPGNDEISTSVCWLLTRAARYPLDPPAIAHFLRLGYWLISKVRVSSLDRARDSIDLVAASVDASLGIVGHATFGEDFIKSRQSPQKQVPETKLVQDSARRPVPLLTPPARSVSVFATASLNIFDIITRTGDARTTA